MELPLEHRVQQYHHLKQMGESCLARAKELSDQIKKELPEGKHEVGTFNVQIQIKDLTSLDQEAAIAMLKEKGDTFYEFCVKQREEVDPVAIESLYLLGELTDSDLRVIRNPNYSTALVVKKNV